MISSEIRRMNREYNDNCVNNNSGKIPVDIIENDKGFVVKSYLPGFSKEEINVSLKDNLLTIKAELKDINDNKNEIYHTKEVYGFKNLDRSLYIPKSCDPQKLRAKLSHGILNLTIPKKKIDSPKIIEIN